METVFLVLIFIVIVILVFSQFISSSAVSTLNGELDTLNNDLLGYSNADIEFQNEINTLASRTSLMYYGGTYTGFGANVRFQGSLVVQGINILNEITAINNQISQELSGLTTISTTTLTVNGNSSQYQINANSVSANYLGVSVPFGNGISTNFCPPGYAIDVDFSGDKVYPRDVIVVPTSIRDLGYYKKMVSDYWLINPGYKFEIFEAKNYQTNENVYILDATNYTQPYADTTIAGVNQNNDIGSVKIWYQGTIVSTIPIFYQ